VMQRAMDGVDVEDFPPPAFVDGEAPETGHAPFTPKPKPTKKPSKKPTKTVEPSETVTVEPSPTVTLPTEPPITNEPGPDCTLFPNHPQCTAEPSPTDLESPVADDGGPGQGTNPRYAYREEYARP